MILDEESKLLGYLKTVTRDLDRRIEVRKETWGLYAGE